MPIHSNLKSLEPRREHFKSRMKLLSGGYSRPESFPDGEITVYPWDASVDDWLTERGKKGDQGNLLYDLCAKVCDLNGCPIDQFVVGDIQAVLLVSRAMRYNSIVEYDAVCSFCGYTSTERAKVPDELPKIGEKDSSYRGWDDILLPDCRDVVRVRPLLVRDEKWISERDEVSRQLISDRIIHILKPIVSVNEGAPDSIEEALRWYNALSPTDAAYLENAENESYPHLDLDLLHQCDRCRKKFTHSLDFNADFFRARLKSVRNAPLASEARSRMERKESDNQPQGSAGSPA